MEQPEYILENGTRIKTREVLGSTGGIFVKPERLAARTSSTVGSTAGPVPGHGGDIYWVLHDDGTLAVYCWTEFDLHYAEEDKTLIFEKAQSLYAERCCT